MIIAMTAVRVMQVATDEIVNVITVRYEFMSTRSTVRVATIVTASLRG